MIKKILNYLRSRLLKKKIDKVSLLDAMTIDPVDRWTTVSSKNRMKNYKDPYIGQKFFCEKEDECYVYVGGKEFDLIYTILE